MWSGTNLTFAAKRFCNHSTPAPLWSLHYITNKQTKTNSTSFFLNPLLAPSKNHIVSNIVCKNKQTNKLPYFKNLLQGNSTFIPNHSHTREWTQTKWEIHLVIFFSAVLLNEHSWNVDWSNKLLNKIIQNMFLFHKETVLLVLVWQYCC